MNTTELKSKLNEQEFFKKAMPGGFLFIKNWKKGYKTYTEAQEKGVAKAMVIRNVKHEDYVYRVLAYSVNGELSAENISKVAEIVNHTEVGVIRYESNTTSGFYPLLDESGELYRKDYSLTGLYKHFDGVFIMIIMDTNGKFENLDCSQIVYVKDGKKMWHWAVEDKNIS